jgi:hypothetical protein
VGEALIRRVRENDRGGFWRAPSRAADSSPPIVLPGAPLRRRLLSWLIAGFALGWSAWELFVAARRVRWQALVAPASVVVIAGLVTLLVPEHLPVHDHNSFLARSDCAFDPDCDEDPRGPAWLPPTFHVYGLLLRLFPERLQTPSLVSLALSLISLALLYALLVRLLTHLERADAARRVGLLSITFLAVQPAWLRIAVGDTFWPYSLCCLLAAGHALISTLRSKRLSPALAASAWLALATLGNIVFLTLVPLALLAPLAWRQTRAGFGWRTMAALAAYIALVLPYFISSYRHAFVGQSSMLTGRGGLGGLLEQASFDFYVYSFDLRLSPAPLALYVICAALSARSSWRALAPFAYVYLATAPFLCMWADHPLASTYPTGFINAFAQLYPLSVLAAFGADWLVARASLRWQRWAIGAALLLPIASMPLAREGVRFMTGERVLERELVEISSSLEQLPPHDLLVEGPHLQPALPGAGQAGDPIEVAFPRGEYAYVLERRRMKPASVVPSEWLIGRELPSDARALVYVGSKLRSFFRSEMEAGLVPDGLERPALVELKRRYLLEPVREFELETAQHPSINVRLGADRVPKLALGFYWLKPRSSATPR